MLALEGKTVLVTGASKGIGAAIARELVAGGASVIAHYNRDRSGAEATIKLEPGDDSLLIQADMADPSGADDLWAAAVADRPRIDVVVLNAAIMEAQGGIEDSRESWDEAWSRQWQINVLSPACLMRHAVRHFLDHGGGTLITISSWAAQRGVTNPSMIAYAASKAAIKAAAQTVARGYAKKNILSYVVAPGVVRTGMSENFAATQGGEDAVTATLAMGEWVPPSDIGHLVAFLASGRARHLTGATLDVNGASYVR
jgi:NAD(P)-dependent dehydrogenase (short-subunit alcohol dehydrogenase family)